MRTHYPTILIGYGGYGLRVLQSFLADAASRGALLWDEQGDVGSLNERRLKALSLFWVPDVLDLPEQKLPDGFAGDGGYELMDDLYAQVETIEGAHDDLPRILADAMEREKKRLLEANRVRRQEIGLFGLDVITVARPTREEVIGAIRDLMEPGMLRLAEDPSLSSAQEGGGNTLLNFLQILDFEDYWTPPMAPVRKALQQVLKEDPEGFAQGRPTLGRVYLFDGTTSQGRRSADSRQREAVLLLELLLLEGIRGEPDAQTLFRRERIDIPPVCTIGVRVVERSSSLLRRLAAASFARGWLDYLAGSGAPSGEGPFNDLVQRFRAGVLSETTGEPALTRAARQVGTQLESALLGIPPEQADWGERLREVADREVDAAILRLSRESGQHSTRLTREVLHDFHDQLEAAITHAIEDRRPGFSAGAVCDELQQLEDEFSKVAFSLETEIASAPPAVVDPFQEADLMQREFVAYRNRQVQTAQLSARWWTRAAIVFALALTPMALQALAASVPDNPVPGSVVVLLSELLLGGAYWLIGRYQVQPALESAAARARQFYTDPDKGRLSERVRQIAASSLVAGRIEAHQRSLSAGLRQYVLGAVAGELHRLRTTLLKRRAEIEWLNRQVGEFLLSHGVDSTGPTPSFMKGRSGPDVRYSLESDSDLRVIADSVPRTMTRFRDLLAMRRLFANWSHPYSDSFLHPLGFLDQLSESFRDPLELDETALHERGARIAQFLQNDASLTVCFHWLVSDGLPRAARWSLFPSVWRSLPRVYQGLADAGFTQNVLETANTERLYLVESVLGVPDDLLTRAK